MCCRFSPEKAGPADAFDALIRAWSGHREDHHEADNQK
jgi:hypothetical protein